MKRLNIDLIEPGDVILTARAGKVSQLIRTATAGEVSHAMICVGYGSVIDSTSEGVQARNLQRELFDADEQVFAFRLRDPLTKLQLSNVTDFARSEVGTRYSIREAARAKMAVRKPRSRQQFCSRLVARAFASIGISLVDDEDYCTPEHLRMSPVLAELPDVTEVVPEEELEAWRRRPNPLDLMRSSQNAVLEVARRYDPSIENFADLDRLVQDRPECDAEIARAYRTSGYLEVWKIDFTVNPWHYDIKAMEDWPADRALTDLRPYCVATIREAYSGGTRFAVNLAYYERAFRRHGRETTGLLAELYRQLVQTDALRRDTALSWLQRHFPEDVEVHIERVIPHSELWFSIVDRVEPNLGAIARASIAAAGTADACSSCGDPAKDFRLVNIAEAMPGVPSLRLCDDCVGIRRSFGEQLEPLV